MYQQATGPVFEFQTFWQPHMLCDVPYTAKQWFMPLHHKGKHQPAYIQSLRLSSS